MDGWVPAHLVCVKDGIVRRQREPPVFNVDGAALVAGRVVEEATAVHVEVAALLLAVDGTPIGRLLCGG